MSLERKPSSFPIASVLSYYFLSVMSMYLYTYIVYLFRRVCVSSLLLLNYKQKMYTYMNFHLEHVGTQCV